MEQTHTTHAGLQTSFSELLIRTGEVDKRLGRLLRRLFSTRNKADYGGGVESGEAEAAVTDAERFVDAVEAWLLSRSG